MSPDSRPPALVLRCRPLDRFLYSAAAVGPLALGAMALAHRVPGRLALLVEITAPLLLSVGAAWAYFVARYCFARLILDDEGLRLAGPLGEAHVRWDSVLRWDRSGRRSGPGYVRVIHGSEARRLTIPLIYEDSHLLEIGLGQGSFPRF